MTAACLLLFVLLVRQFFPAGTEKLRQFLLPAAPTVTQSAFNDLLSEIRSGASVNDAFTAFCEQIIDHDEILSG